MLIRAPLAAAARRRGSVPPASLLGAVSAPARCASAKAAGLNARVAAVLGSQWGDEGKGKLADVLAKNYDIVARFNGGANAGHTVVVDGKKFAFHLLPCGLIYPHTQNLLGNGTVVHLPSLFAELDPLEPAGVDWRGRLKLSDRATLLFDFHKTVDGRLEEARRASAAGGGKSIGTTKQGIGPAYASKMTRNAVRVGHLRHRAAFRQRLAATIADHQAAYGFECDVGAEVDRFGGGAWCMRVKVPVHLRSNVGAWYDEYASRVQDWIVDGVAMLHTAAADGKRILAEGANAAMLDIDFGTYPFVTSSSTTAGGVCTGLGLPPSSIDAVVGVVKAYTTRVGGGPFPTELTDSRGGGEVPDGAPGTDVGLHLQTVGGEVGVTTGRKRRCGWFDAVVVRYAHALNGFTSLNLTKLDVLDDVDEIKIGVGYKLDGALLPDGAFPAMLEDLSRVEVVYETLPGWRARTRGVTTFAALPPRAQAYVRRLEAVTGVPIAWIGTGAGRTDMITRGFKL